MNFIDFNFYIFLILTLVIYYILPKKAQWICLLAASGIFYLTYTKWYFVVLLFSITVTFLISFFMQKKSNERAEYLKFHKADMSREEVKEYKQKIKGIRKRICIVGVVLNVGLLVGFKYTGFFIDSINQIVHANISFATLAVPIGISYYIFKSTGYMIDVYRETYEAEQNPFKYALFVSFFPAILMGPLGRFGEEKEQLYAEHNFDYDNFMLGVQRIMWGFFKKMFIADRLSGYVTGIYADYQNHGGLQLALTVLLFAIQEYADFSGFMDISLGMARLFEIRIAENFQTPFMSATVGEFWRRWHITMGAWFRDYVFYEVICSKFCKNVAKNKKISKYWKQAIPVIVGNSIIWVLIGFWHGASWHHVFWGIYNGVLIILAFMFQDGFEKVNTLLHVNTEALYFKIFQRVRTFLLFAIGELFFTAGTFEESLRIAARMVLNISTMESLRAVKEYIKVYPVDATMAIIGISVLFVTEILQYNKVELGNMLYKQHLVIRWVAYLVCIFSIIVFGIYGLNNAAAFIYMGI